VASRISLDEASKLVGRRGIRPHVWLRNNASLFEDVALDGASVIDIGSGAGWASAYAAVAGARRVVSVEPQADGSGSDMLETAAALRRELRLEKIIEIVPKAIEEAGITDKFDIVLVNNAVNHIHEEACAILDRDPEARAVYAPFFQQLADSCVDGGALLVADCTNRNFFGDFGFKSPIVPTIDWRIHQPPEVWARLLESFGFTDPKISWTPLARTGWVGRLFGRNRFAAYFINSHFRLKMTRRRG
jgi:SAM-dependent methyltransferase